MPHETLHEFLAANRLRPRPNLPPQAVSALRADGFLNESGTLNREFGSEQLRIGKSAPQKQLQALFIKVRQSYQSMFWFLKA
ncbi:hypothetical protein SAMN06265374_4458 [Roseibium denhamense]|uniref:Uncharacterized protein n=1 Tax=Roseibium denhamense TaxID=76305 RepID=A0ABY1PMA7_9HYPH|nr:hypothetical protein SAMN06265374_4458 [Roseibium denhamense]